MNSLIIYGSQYGSTRRYAEHLAEMTGMAAVDYREAKGIDRYDGIVYLGALYAGGVMGLKKTVEKLAPGQKLVMVTVGLADPANEANITSIRRSIKTQVPTQFYDESRCFHLRGAIDYRRLGLKHRVMMSMLHAKVAKMPQESLNPEAQAMLDTYGKQVDFVDFSTLEPIIRILK